MASQETKAMRLETFLKRAYKLDKRIKRPSKSEYYTLTRAEEKGDYYKELKAVKERIAKAIEIFLNQDLSVQTRDDLEVLDVLNTQVKNSDDVSSLIERGLANTEQFK